MGLEVSVVIPSFNRAHLIAETLDSISRQTLPPLEIIVVDDGSTDDTEAVVRSRGPLVRYHRTENSGVCHARNAGIARARAPWIAFCDSDDRWRPDKLERQAGLLARAPEVEYVFSDFVTIANGVISPETKFDRLPLWYWDVPKHAVAPDELVLEEPFYDRILRWQPIFPSTVLLSRRFLDRVGPMDETLGRNVSEDLEFTLRCLQESPVGVVISPLVEIRKHSSNFSRDRVRSLLGEVEILNLALGRHPRARLYQETIESEIARRSSVAAGFAFRAGDLDTAAQAIDAIPAPRRSLRDRVKRAITRLPRPLALALRTAIATLVPAIQADEAARRAR